MVSQKFYERFLHDSLSKFTCQIISKSKSAFGKSCGSIHVLMRLIEDWKAYLGNKKGYELYSWTGLKHFTVSRMTYLLQNFMHMD